MQRLDAGDLQDLIKLSQAEVGHANAPGNAIINQLLHCFPGVCKGDLVIKDDVVAREIVPHARHECIRPVDQHTVNVAAVQVLQTGLCTLAHILRAMAVIEDLGHNVQVLTLPVCWVGSYPFLDFLANHGFVEVQTSSVNVAVARLQSLPCSTWLLHQECAIRHDWHLASIGKLDKVGLLARTDGDGVGLLHHGGRSYNCTPCV
mmetsp:Transcript_4505/g.12299  ORF Transcript_4505/g.12299 Transcript_4505/m.12299 type:complete len:204 (+) Transcript_4505:617-1228(+)